MQFRPLSVLAIVMASIGAVEGGRMVLNGNNALAADKAAGKDEKKTDAKKGTEDPAKDPANAYVDGNQNANQLQTELAKESGVSASEFKLLQALQERRQNLDKRESDIITREGVLKTAEAIVLQRIETLKGVEANIQKLLGQVDELEAQRLSNLVSVYEKMKPKDAARVWDGMSDEVLIPIASRMKNQSLSLILAKMSPVRARQVTAKLAQIDDSGSLVANNPANGNNSPTVGNSAKPPAANTPAAANKQMAQNQGNSADGAKRPAAPNVPNAAQPNASSVKTPTTPQPKTPTTQNPIAPNPAAGQQGK